MKQTIVKRTVRVLRCIPAVFGMAAIFAASATTGEEMNTLLPFFKSCSRKWRALIGDILSHILCLLLPSISQSVQEPIV